MDKLDPIEGLKKYRELLVSERRRLIEDSLATGVAEEGSVYESQYGPTLESVEKIVGVQTQIEAIDRAIDDEKKIGSASGYSAGVRRL